MVRLSWDAVLAWRTARQGLAARAPAGELLDVVSRLCGVHAQVASSAELTLWTRLDGLAPGTVDRLLWEQRMLVKTWAMRGTLHLLPAAELPRYTAALSRLKPRHHQAAWLRAHGLERTQAEAMLAAIRDVLAGGAPLTREELAHAVAARTGHAELAGKLAGGFGDLLKPAAFAGDLCHAAPDGRLVRFTAPRAWVGGQEPADPVAASAAVVRAYLAAYGPAPREQFQRWFGMSSPAEAGRWLRELGDELEEVGVDGERGWMLAADVAEAAAGEPAGATRLLPGFDQYVVTAPRAAEAVLPAAFRTRVYRTQGWLSPVLFVDGRMAGVWSHERRGEDLAVEVDAFAPPSGDVRDGVEEEAARLAAFLGAGRAAVRWA
jgi:uncharacterized protein YcaQ